MLGHKGAAPNTLALSFWWGRGVKRFYSVLSRNSVSAKDSEPTLQRHPFAPAGSNRHQSMIAQPINYNGRRIAIPEECEIPQKTQVAPP